LSVRIPQTAAAPMAIEAAAEVRLIDGSRLRATGFSTDGTTATVEHPHLGAFKLPLTVVQSVRFAAPDAKVDAAWSPLVEKAPKKDQVVVRKGDVLDHLDGVIGSLDGTSLKFQLDGDDIPVKRERIFGLIYAKRESVANKALSAVDLVSNDRLAARSVSFDQETWKVKLASGAEVSVPQSQVAMIDFSLGKIAYLSNLEPREVKYTPYIDFVFEYRRDRMVHGGPLSVGGKTYAKGLGLHSRTLLKYRIGGDYRRFQTIMGIDDSLRSGGSGDVDVVIKGDGRTLFKGPVSIYERIEKGAANSTEPRLMQPINLDLDVTGVVELEILVDYGEKDDIGDCLNLADAKVVK
jgi:NPCBM/NEW2 domain